MILALNHCSNHISYIATSVTLPTYFSLLPVSQFGFFFHQIIFRQKKV